MVSYNCALDITLPSSRHRGWPPGRPVTSAPGLCGGWYHTLGPAVSAAAYPQVTLVAVARALASVDVLPNGQRDTDDRQCAGPGDQGDRAGAWRDQVIDSQAHE